ncbi:MAG: hypothetical protein AVDCRST_MAG78-1407 [uncultured Rubrobacteraceae bacterium]|uniref:Uncharacterized protein n=1 Tax=uncultured Rubrobacteraceae bacterium TaxID=349277 RepID=A0A6J4PV28_9ACTN|nr:MAG: hypothetical protein AVDCRST_MAG78-1407 [uncultured Rubrobacteraceae bacterium]
MVKPGARLIVFVVTFRVLMSLTALLGLVEQD